jgi:serine/threonine protein kinase
MLPVVGRGPRFAPRPPPPHPSTPHLPLRPPPPHFPSHNRTSASTTPTHWYHGWQGGLTIPEVFTIMQQTIAGLRHLHRLGILHRDLRSANVLVDSKDPLRVVLADFGLSHVLSAVTRLEATQQESSSAGSGSAGGPAGSLSAGRQGTLLRGSEALGPIAWMAPEVCADTSGGRLATFPSDVYMLGGLLYELLTCGLRPFHWLLENPALLERRRRSSGRVPVPGAPGVYIEGLLGRGVLEVAAGDGQVCVCRDV